MKLIKIYNSMATNPAIQIAEQILTRGASEAKPLAEANTSHHTAMAKMHLAKHKK